MKAITVATAPDPGLLVASEVNLTSIIMDEQQQVILVTAPSSRAGTTRSVASLALHLAGTVTGRVLIVDTSRSLNNLSNSEGAGRIPGFLNVVIDGGEQLHPADFVVQLNVPKGDVDLLPLGQGSDMASRHVTKLRNLFERLKQCYRFIIIDSDSVYEDDSTLLLSAIADSTLLVIAAESHRWEVAQATVDRLRLAGARIAGVIFNRRRYYMPRWVYEKL